MLPPTRRRMHLKDRKRRAVPATTPQARPAPVERPAVPQLELDEWGHVLGMAKLWDHVLAFMPPHLDTSVPKARAAIIAAKAEAFLRAYGAWEQQQAQQQAPPVPPSATAATAAAP